MYMIIYIHIHIYLFVKGLSPVKHFPRGEARDRAVRHLTMCP